MIYNSQGDYARAIEYNFLASNLAEINKDSINILIANNSLGIAYYNIGENIKAIQYLKKAYSIALKNKLLFEQAGLLVDLGNAHKSSKNYETAIYYHEQAIALATKISDKRLLCTALQNNAATLMDVNAPLKAVGFLNQSLALSKEIKYLRGELDNYAFLSTCYFQLKHYGTSKRYALQLKEIGEKAGTVDLVKTSYYNLYKVYDVLKQIDSAYFFFQKYTTLKDSFINENKYKEIAGREFQYQKLKDDEVRKLEKQLAIKELGKQKQIKNIIFGASLLLLILLGFVLFIYVGKQKASIEIAKQNRIIEDKNKDITDSINYSRNIQNAILTPENKIHTYLPDSFVLFMPKDIVSGDFYFIKPILSNPSLISIGLADCTGHGVPGAFMSIIGYTILNQSMKENHEHTPAQTLNYLNTELEKFLRQNHHHNINDGMDIAFCIYDTVKQQLSYAGANNPIWIISSTREIKNIKGETLNQPYSNESLAHHLFEIKPDKQPIGFNTSTKPFTNHIVKLNKGDTVYLFSDGFADQFGGEEITFEKAGRVHLNKFGQGKKFKNKQLAHLLLQHAALPLHEQKAIFQTAFNAWRGDIEQVDDVCIIGVKF